MEQNHDSMNDYKVATSKILGLEDLSLTIQGPTILGILGPSGAGKSQP